MQVHGDEQIGEVSVENDPSHPLSDEELAFVEQVAEQVSLALESARLFAQTQATLGETEDLYQASAELNAATTFDEVLSAVRKSVDKEEEAHILSIGLFDHPWTDTLPAQSVDILATWSSLPEQAVAHFPQHFMVNDSPMAMALKPNAATVIEDARADPNLDESLRAMLLNALFTQSAINAPLTVSGKWIGFMSVSFPRPRKFPEDEIRRLMAISSQAAIAINNMLLLETTRVRAQRERILREVTTRVRASVDADTILRTAVRELGTALGREAFIRLGNPAQQSENV
jgi:GAF domain-containing protein